MVFYEKLPRHMLIKLQEFLDSFLVNYEKD